MRAKQIKEAKEEVFTEVLARTGKPSSAIKASHPEVYERNPQYAREKANGMLKRPDIQAKITHKLEKMTPLALKRAKELTMSDNEMVATANTWKILEHIRGKPIARNVSLNATASVEDVLANLE